jgi:hypothetical protein
MVASFLYLKLQSSVVATVIFWNTGKFDQAFVKPMKMPAA